MAQKGRIVVNDNYCKGCELCVAVCPKHLLKLDPDRMNPKGYHTVNQSGEGCSGCAVCAVVCPEVAITVFREVKKIEDEI